jgi:hypothetical protein
LFPFAFRAEIHLGLGLVGAPELRPFYGVSKLVAMLVVHDGFAGGIEEESAPGNPQF